MTTPHSTASIERTSNLAFATGLRALADLIAAHPRASAEYDEYRHLIYVGNRDELAAVVREIGGRWQKDAEPGDYFGLTRDLGGGVTIYVYAARGQVCERVQVGTQVVKRPDPDADVPMVEVEEPVFEWRCAPSLLSDPPVTSAEDEAWRERGWRESRDDDAPDRDDGRPVSEEGLMRGYGLAVHADEIARRRRVPHALKRDLGIGGER